MQTYIIVNSMRRNKIINNYMMHSFKLMSAFCCCNMYFLCSFIFFGIYWRRIIGLCSVLKMKILFPISNQGQEIEFLMRYTYVIGR